MGTLSPERRIARFPRFGVLAGRALLSVLLVLGLLLAVVDGLQDVPFYVSFALVGAALVVRRPRNSIGWLLLVLSALQVVSSMTLPVMAGPLLSGTAPLAVRLVAWLIAVTGYPVFPGFALLSVVVPSGRLPGGRWGLLVRALIVANAAVVLAIAVGPTIPVSVDGGTYVNAANPLALLPSLSWWAAFYSNGNSGGNDTSGILLLVTLASAAIGMVVRLRQAQGLERLQLRWLVASIVLVVGATILAVVTQFWVIIFLSVPTIPLAIGVAILRYRLYEIDRLVSRTLAYGLVTVVLLAVFGGTILALQALLSSLTGGNTLAVAGSTLLVAVLFQPLRRRVQAVVDRRFNRRRYDAQVAVAAFSERLRDEVDLGGIRAEILGTAHSTLQPATASIWLRGEHQPGQR
jgi:hypothetical protein